MSDRTGRVPLPLPRGEYAVMLTPFLDSGAVDYPSLQRLTRWYLRSGCVGLFPVAQSGEMYDLSPEEVCSSPNLRTLSSYSSSSCSSLTSCLANSGLRWRER
jgi:hypothetical protein